MVNIIEKEFIGQFELKDTVDVTDPCYEKDTWCRKTLECKPGIYYGYAEFSDEESLGKRVARLSIYKDNINIPLDEMKIKYTDIGVDSGLCGFFNNKPDFNGNEWRNFLHVTGCMADYNSKLYKRVYSIMYGIFSESGYGDGSYTVYINADKTAFTLVFIDDEDDD